jgi:hypothetical protein
LRDTLGNMRAPSFLIVSFLAILLAACGGDDGADVDAASAVIDAAETGDDAAAGGDHDAAGGGLQFCGEEGDPDCPGSQECCDDGVCRDSCGGGGGTGTYQCDGTAECPTGSMLCCQTSEDRFCTRQRTCDTFGGEEVNSCS